jgi:hypothetical protein
MPLVKEGKVWGVTEENSSPIMERWKKMKGQDED